MATTEARLIALAQAIGTDIKAIKTTEGNLASLNTVTKTSLVAAINELVGFIGSAGAQINDAAGNGDLTVTWSANMIYDSIAAASAAVKDSILGGAGAAFDTLQELATALGGDADFATTIASGLNNRVRFDAAQTLTNPQKIQARANIAAADDAALAALIAALGDTDVDLVSSYNTAKT